MTTRICRIAWLVSSAAIISGCGGDSGSGAVEAATGILERNGVIVEEVECRSHPGLESGNGTSYYLCTGAFAANGQTQRATLTVSCADSGPCRTDY